MNNKFKKTSSLINRQQQKQCFTMIKSNFCVSHKKIIILVIAITMIIIGLASSIYIFYNNNSSEGYKLSVNMIEHGDKVVNLKKGDKLVVNAWNPPIEVTLNDEELENIPILYNGVTLGTNVKDVIKKFNIKSGYAVLNMEVPTEEEDGTTDIIEKNFKNYNSIPKEFLDCAIIFGYKKVNGKWKMVKGKKINDADIVYYIDINGFDDGMYGINEVILFMVAYNK